MNKPNGPLTISERKVADNLPIGEYVHNFRLVLTYRDLVFFAKRALAAAKMNLPVGRPESDITIGKIVYKLVDVHATYTTAINLGGTKCSQVARSRLNAI